jgi:very-short-patch-repair endonuclease
VDGFRQLVGSSAIVAGVGGIDGPFIGTEALEAGCVSRRGLHNGFDVIYRNVYLPKGYALTAATRAKAAWLWAHRDATVAGLSAAALHGTKWIDASLPAELIRIGDAARGIVIHRDKLVDDEVCVIDGMAATTPARTAFDLGRRGRLEVAVIRLDALACATRLQRWHVDPLVERHRGARGIVQLRQAVELMDAGAESPQETRTRLLLINAGFPRPKTQIVICNEYDEFVARIDMGWPEWRVGVQYDGPQHWTDPDQHARDIDQQAELQALNWRIIRVSRNLLRYRSSVFLGRTCQAMRVAGWPHCDEIRLDAQISLDRVA